VPATISPTSQSTHAGDDQEDDLEDSNRSESVTPGDDQGERVRPSETLASPKSLVQLDDAGTDGVPPKKKKKSFAKKILKGIKTSLSSLRGKVGLPLCFASISTLAE
jgi:hypothetical protein